MTLEVRQAFPFFIMKIHLSFMARMIAVGDRFSYEKY